MASLRGAVKTGPMTISFELTASQTLRGTEPTPSILYGNTGAQTGEEAYLRASCSNLNPVVLNPTPFPSSH